MTGYGNYHRRPAPEVTSLEQAIENLRATVKARTGAAGEVRRAANARLLTLQAEAVITAYDAESDPADPNRILYRDRGSLQDRRAVGDFTG
jgi:hypothetical protein